MLIYDGLTSASDAACLMLWWLAPALAGGNGHEIAAKSLWAHIFRWPRYPAFANRRDITMKSGDFPRYNVCRVQWQLRRYGHVARYAHRHEK